MTPEQMKTELQRQLDTGEATRADYEQAVQNSESEMALMHVQASYDVRRYMMLENSVKIYREFLGMSASTISERSRVPAGLSDSEYKTHIAAQLPEAAKEPAREKPCWECGGTVRNDVCVRCGERQSDNPLN